MKSSKLRWIGYGLLGLTALVTGIAVRRKWKNRSRSESDPSTESNRPHRNSSADTNGDRENLGKYFATRTNQPQDLSRSMLFVRHEIEAIVNLLAERENGQMTNEIDQLLEALSQGQSELQSVVSRD